MSKDNDHSPASALPTEPTQEALLTALFCEGMRGWKHEANILTRMIPAGQLPSASAGAIQKMVENTLCARLGIEAGDVHVTHAHYTSGYRVTLPNTPEMQRAMQYYCEAERPNVKIGPWSNRRGVVVPFSSPRLASGYAGRLNAALFGNGVWKETNGRLERFVPGDIAPLGSDLLPVIRQALRPTYIPRSEITVEPMKFEGKEGFMVSVPARDSYRQALDTQCRNAGHEARGRE